MTIPADQCVALLRDALSNRPTDPWSDDTSAWFAHVAGIAAAYSPFHGATFHGLLPRVTNVSSGVTSPLSATMTMNAQSEFIARARSMLTELQLSSNTFTTRQIGPGSVHDYFEEIRQIVAGATRDILFVDPYIDPSFVTRYVPLIYLKA